MKIIDKVWMLVHPTNGAAYQIGKTPQEVWLKVINRELFGTGTTKNMLLNKGW